jgi:hypothetical protein
MRMQRRKFIGTLTATISTVALAGCGGSESEDFEQGNENTNSGGSSNDVELLSHRMVRQDEDGPAESVAVEGEAENVDGGELSYAEVEVKFYEGDTLAESFLDNINGWSAGETWAFEVQYPGIGEDAAAITDYEIRAGTSL